MKPTFNELIQSAAKEYANVDIGNYPYTGDNEIVANTIAKGINIGYQKIAREKYKILHKELITLNDDASFNTNDLSKTFHSINEIKDSGGELASFIFEDDATVKCHEIGAGGRIYVYYYYIPSKLVNNNLTTDITDFPEGAFDEECLAYYGAFHYLTTQNDTTAQYYGVLFNNEFNMIRPNKGKAKTVKSRMRW